METKPCRPKSVVAKERCIVVCYLSVGAVQYLVVLTFYIKIIIIIIIITIIIIIVIIIIIIIIIIVIIIITESNLI